MMTLHRYEGKNEELVLNECLLELNVELTDIYYTKYESDSGLFKSKKVIIEAITKEEIIQYIKKYISELSKNMCISINCEVRIDENNINVLLVTDNNNIMIGKDGKTLNSIQLLLRQATKDLNKFNIRIILDVGNYKSKKLKNLDYEIKRICKEVLNTKLEVKLDPMNSYERRLVHSIVSEFEGLQSISYGEAPERYTVIKIKD